MNTLPSTMQPTQRTYCEFWTKEQYVMYCDTNTHAICLVANDGKVITNFAASAFHGVSYRFLDESELTLSAGEFIILDKLNPITHKKYIGQKRFSKIN